MANRVELTVKAAPRWPTDMPIAAWIISGMGHEFKVKFRKIWFRFSSRLQPADKGTLAITARTLSLSRTFRSFRLLSNVYGPVVCGTGHPMRCARVMGQAESPPTVSIQERKILQLMRAARAGPLSTVLLCSTGKLSFDRATWRRMKADCQRGVCGSGWYQL